MTDNRIRTLMPKYMKEFQCIGTNCCESCCIGWKVLIDNHTYKKYQNLKSSELSPLFHKCITRNRSNPSKENYAKINMNEDNSCPFLNENKLCNIQLKHGAEYLSNVCTIYPRITNMIDGTIELSGTVSCPEIARLALLNPKLMEFDENYEYLKLRNVEIKNIDTKSQPKNSTISFFWQFRIITISILQNRKFKIWERMIILGLFYRKLQDYINNKKMELVPDLVEYYSDFMDQNDKVESFAFLQTNLTVQVKLLEKLVEKKIHMGISSKRYIECFENFLNGLQYTNESTIKDIIEKYNNAYNDYYEPFMKEHEYILENYLVNYVFKNLFPFNGYNSVFDSYMMLVIHYSLIKMHLIGMSAFHKGLTIELVIKLIQSFSKTIEHNQAYLNDIAEIMRENDYNTMAYMAVLIRN